jgi:hypothetical protein
MDEDRITIGTMIREPFYMPSSLNVLCDLQPHYFMVDKDLKIIAPDHKPALTKISVFPGVQPHNPAKAVYRLNIELTRRVRKAGHLNNGGTLWSESIARGSWFQLSGNIQGTAIHLGNSVFLTCARTLQWPTPPGRDEWRTRTEPGKL